VTHYFAHGVFYFPVTLPTGNYYQQTKEEFGKQLLEELFSQKELLKKLAV